MITRDSRFDSLVFLVKKKTLGRENALTKIVNRSFIRRKTKRTKVYSYVCRRFEYDDDAHANSRMDIEVSHTILMIISVSSLCAIADRLRLTNAMEKT